MTEDMSRNHLEMEAINNNLMALGRLDMTPCQYILAHPGWEAMVMVETPTWATALAHPSHDHNVTA